MIITYNNNFYEQVFIDKTKFHSTMEMVSYTCGKHCEISSIWIRKSNCGQICEANNVPVCCESWYKSPWYWKQIIVPWKKLSIF